MEESKDELQQHQREDEEEEEEEEEGGVVEERGGEELRRSGVEARSGEWERVAPWRRQVTVRGVAAGAAIGIVYSVIVMKLILTTGLVPTLNVSAALLAFVVLRGWTKLLRKLGLVAAPFTRQENTVVQTCAVACYSIAVGGGFGSYLLGLNKKTYELAGVDTEGNVPGSYKEPVTASSAVAPCLDGNGSRRLGWRVSSGLRLGSSSTGGGA
ncbi:probable metal-nicotianamine transporter YSL9 [Ananas comosus]|uniref:Probable metal-nicotianamine transporter YSL9 n=1 Tax=Ananas comosus TaxID=4615 RepID=A0A6P5EHD8_ANACO|nr:probable metal-nicotianamine transporter YSL9 [Ananas comosus]